MTHQPRNGRTPSGGVGWEGSPGPTRQTRRRALHSPRKAIPGPALHAPSSPWRTKLCTQCQARHDGCGLALEVASWLHCVRSTWHWQGLRGSTAIPARLGSARHPANWDAVCLTPRIEPCSAHGGLPRHRGAARTGLPVPTRARWPWPCWLLLRLPSLQPPMPAPGVRADTARLSNRGHSFEL